ncbi:MAG: signal recognition particle-docking protein FtsY [Gammaproteobacteria bacterium]|nr:signal recognition particle-docking protein FtsY [Gammaproteobacteria bacterium]
MFLSRRDPAAPNADTGRSGLLTRLRRGLERTRAGLTEKLAALVLGRRAIDADLLEEIETVLLTADVGVEATRDIVARLTAQVARRELGDAEALYRALREDMIAVLRPAAIPLTVPAPGEGTWVILVVGVNGAGKTTTIGKLAHRLRAEGRSVMMAAGDTFRAAAVEQLQRWGERVQAPVIAQQTGADSASVVYDALQAARARRVDVLLADTAGRLHTREPLMEELKKVRRVLGKVDPTAPHEVLLVLDAGTGQNALSQARHFQSAVQVTGLALTKLDGTAKGGIVFAIARELGLPIRFIGIGEGVEDLRPFDAEAFVDALLEH